MSSGARLAPLLFLTVMGLAQSCLSSSWAEQAFQAAPPPPAPVPPNSSRILATVLKHAVWPPGSLQNTRPPVPPDQTFYSLTMEIHTADPEQPGLDSLARPGLVIEAFSSDMLTPDLVRRQINATVKLRGDTRGVRWWISNVHARP